jgi:hypothetical protein
MYTNATDEMIFLFSLSHTISLFDIIASSEADRNPMGTAQDQETSPLSASSEADQAPMSGRCVDKQNIIPCLLLQKQTERPCAACAWANKSIVTSRDLDDVIENMSKTYIEDLMIALVYTIVTAPSIVTHPYLFCMYVIFAIIFTAIAYCGISPSSLENNTSNDTLFVAGTLGFIISNYTVRLVDNCFFFFLSFLTFEINQKLTIHNFFPLSHSLSLTHTISSSQIPMSFLLKLAICTAIASITAGYAWIAKRKAIEHSVLFAGAGVHTPRYPSDLIYHKEFGYYTLLTTKPPKKGMIMFLHGNGADAPAFYGFVTTLATEGWDIVMPEYFGYGVLSKLPLSITETRKHIIRIWHRAAQTYKDQKRVVLGFSLGGGFCILGDRFTY